MKSNVEEIIQRMLEVTDFTREIDLAKFLKIGKSSISNWKSNNKVPANHILHIAVICGVNPVWLKTGKGNKYAESSIRNPKDLEQYDEPENIDLASKLVSSEPDDEHQLRINLYDYELAAGNGIINLEYPDVISSIWFTQDGLQKVVGRRSTEGIRMFTVPTDSMEPTISAKDIVFIDIRVTSYIGEGIYAFRLNGEDYIKRLQRLPTGIIRALSDNPMYPPFDITEDLFYEAEIIGKFIRVVPIQPRDL